MRGTRAQQPSGVQVSVGALYYVTDEKKTERWNGAAWESYSGVSAAVMAAEAPELQQQIDDLRARLEVLEAR